MDAGASRAEPANGDAAARAVTRQETRHSLALWFGILAAPLAWAAQVIVAPDVAEVICYAGAGAGRGEVWGLGIDLFLVVLTAVLTVAGLAGGIVATRCLLQLRRGGDDTSAHRATWMAVAGVLVSTLFLLSIVVGFLPMVFLEGCSVPL